MKRLPVPPAPALTAEEQRIVMAFRTMDARGKRENLARMERDADAHPHRARPALHLVGGAR